MPDEALKPRKPETLKAERPLQPEAQQNVEACEAADTTEACKHPIQVRVLLFWGSGAQQF